MKKYFGFLIIILLLFLSVYDDVFALACNGEAGKLSNSYVESVRAGVPDPDSTNWQYMTENICGPYFNKKNTDNMEILFIQNTTLTRGSESKWNGVINRLNSRETTNFEVLSSNDCTDTAVYLHTGVAYYKPFLSEFSDGFNTCPNYIKKGEGTYNRTDDDDVVCRDDMPLYIEAKNYDDADYFYGRELISICKYGSRGRFHDFHIVNIILYRSVQFQIVCLIYRYSDLHRMTVRIVENNIAFFTY